MMSDLDAFLNQHPGLRERLALVGLFQGYVSAPVLAGISARSSVPNPLPSCNEISWIETLQPLHQAGLLQRAQENSAYIPASTAKSLHDLLAQNFQCQLPALQRAFAETYAWLARDLTQRYAIDPPHALFFLRPEEQNLVRALQLARQFRLWSIMIDLLIGLEKLFVPAGHWKEWEWLISNLGELPLADDETPATDLDAAAALHEQVLRCQTEIARHFGRHEVEEKHLLQLRELCLRRKDLRGAAEVLGALGNLARRLDRYNAAHTLWQECLGCHRQLNNPSAEVTVLHDLGSLALDQGRSDEATGWFDESLQAARRCSDLSGQCRALTHLGNIAEHTKQVARAGDHYRALLRLRETANDNLGQAEALELLGNLALQEEQVQDAEHWLRRGAQLYKSAGREKDEGRLLTRLGDAFVQERAFDRAEALYRQALHLQVHLNDSAGQAYTLSRMGRLAVQRQDLSQAQQWLSQSENLLTPASDPGLRADILDSLGTVAYINTAFDLAEDFYQQSLHIRDTLGSFSEKAAVLYNLGLVAERRKDLPVARTRHEESLQLAAQCADVSRQLQAGLQLASIAFQQGNLQEAQRRSLDALALAETHQAASETAEIHYRLGRIAGALCQSDEAEQRYRLSLELYRQQNDLESYLKILGYLDGLPNINPDLLAESYRHGLPLAEHRGDAGVQLKILYRLAALAEGQEHWIEAEHCYRRCLGLEAANSSKAPQAFVLQKLGLILHQQGRPAEAILLFRRSIDLAGFPNGKEPFHTTVLDRLGRAAVEKRDFEEAFVYFQQALKLADDLGDNPARAKARLGLGRVAIEIGDIEHGQAWFEQALEIAVESEHRQHETAALIALGDLAKRAQKWKEAERHLSAALKHQQTLKNEAGQAKTLVQLAEVNEEQGRRKKAAQLFEQAAALFAELHDAQSLYRVRTALARLAGS